MIQGFNIKGVYEHPCPYKKEKNLKYNKCAFRVICDE